VDRDFLNRAAQNLLVANSAFSRLMQTQEAAKTSEVKFVGITSKDMKMGTISLDLTVIGSIAALAGRARD
jgi:hypothetical protein